MKNALIIICLLVGSLQSYGQISIVDAINQQKVDLNVTGNDESTHYLLPLNFTVENKTSKSIKLLIPIGLTLDAVDTEEQNFVITEELLVQIPARTKKGIDIHAMCIESIDRAPDQSSKYRVGAIANEELISFLKFVAEKKLYGPEAQFMVWDIVNNVMDYKVGDSIMVNDDGEFGFYRYTPMQEYVAVEQKEPEPVPRLIEVTGNFEINLGSSKYIHIAMFNDNNVLVKELYNNPNCPQGLTKINYTFNSVEFEEGDYQIKVVMDDRIMLKRNIELKA